MEDEKNTYKFLLGKLEGMRPLGRQRREWRNNSKIDIREIRLVWTGFIWLRTRKNRRIL
jgi:hypothetical protein